MTTITKLPANFTRKEDNPVSTWRSMPLNTEDFTTPSS